MTLPASKSEAPARAARFILLLSVTALALGAAIRARISFASVLPPDQPLPWFVAGLLQDVAIIGCVAAAAMFLARVAPRAASAFHALFVFAVTILHFAFSEATVFFGHTIRAEDLQTQLHPRIFIGSAQGKLLATFIGVIVFYWALVVVLQRLSHRGERVPRAIAVAAVALGCAGAAFAFPRTIHQLETSANPLVQVAILLGKNPLDQLKGAVDIPRPSQPVLQIRELAGNDGRRWIDDDRPLAYLPAPSSARRVTLPEGVKPNIVFFLMEGMRGEESGAYGSYLKDVTPFIDEYSRRGIRFEEMYSSGSYTPEGEVGMWYGLLASPYELIVRTRPQIALTGLPEILRAAGWKDFLWIHPGDQTLYLSSRFYKTRGFKLIDGRDFPPDEPRTNWGYSDKALARRAIELMNRTEEPFASMVLTVSNHHPYQLPPDADDAYEVSEEIRNFPRLSVGSQVLGVRTAAMLQTVHYTDESLGYFMEHASKQPWFKNTIFVITGDHGTSVTPLRPVRDIHDVFRLRHHVPALIYSPMFEGGITIPGPTSHVDIVPTLLGLLGIRGARIGLGVDLLAAAPPEERPLLAWSSIAGMANVLKRHYSYHASVDVSKGKPTVTEEFLFDLHDEPKDRQNLVNARPEVAAELRRDMLTFMELYPWLLAHGKMSVKGMESRGTR